MGSDDGDTSSPDETLERHRALTAVLEGKRAMGWQEWKLPFYESITSLTPAGRQVALWAADILAGFLGVNYPDAIWQRMRQGKIEGLHPLFMGSLWPGMNQAPWVYANLFQLAAQIALLGDRCAPMEKLLLSSHNRYRPESWMHALLQLEVAGLGLRAGWQATFEPELGNRRQADVRLELTPSTPPVMVEIQAMWQSEDERRLQRFERELGWQLEIIHVQHGVRLRGSLGGHASIKDMAAWLADPVSAQAYIQWLGEIERAAVATAQDNEARTIAGPLGAWVQVLTTQLPGENEGTMMTLESTPMSKDAWHGIVRRIQDKNRQMAGAGSAWLRLEENTGLWYFTSLSALPLPDKLASLAPRLWEVLATCPNLAGVILAPSVLWATGSPSEVLYRQVDAAEGLVALRTPLPGSWCRETLMVTRSGPFDAGGEALLDWYAQETTWLDWALERLGKPPLGELIREFTSANESH